MDVETKPQHNEYNCRDKNCCTVDNQRLKLQLIYQADITNNLGHQYRYHLELFEISIKKQNTNHKSSLDTVKTAQLLKFVWKLNNVEKTPTIKCRDIFRMSSNIWYEAFTKRINEFKPLTTFAKNFFLHLSLLSQGMHLRGRTRGTPTPSPSNIF